MKLSGKPMPIDFHCHWLCLMRINRKRAWAAHSTETKTDTDTETEFNPKQSR